MAEHGLPYTFLLLVEQGHIVHELAFIMAQE